MGNVVFVYVLHMRKFASARLQQYSGVFPIQCQHVLQLPAPTAVCTAGWPLQPRLVCVQPCDSLHHLQEQEYISSSFLFPDIHPFVQSYIKYCSKMS